MKKVLLTAVALIIGSTITAKVINAQSSGCISVTPTTGASFTPFVVQGQNCGQNALTLAYFTESGEIEDSIQIDADSGNFQVTLCSLQQTGTYTLRLYNRQLTETLAETNLSVQARGSTACNDRVCQSSRLSCPINCPAIPIEGTNDQFICAGTGDYETPENELPEGYPFPAPEIQCTEELDNNSDFHSLRPFQASVSCTAYNSTINSYYCGNDLVTRQTFTIAHDEVPEELGVTSQNCTTNEAGVIHCDYQVQGSIPVNVDLSSAQLPIMGLTEGPYVINSQSRTEGTASDASLMNEYVSWYMNGVIGRAEDNILTYDTRYPLSTEEVDNLEESDKKVYLRALEDARKLIVYSGPLRKLLPWRIQNRQRTRQIEDVVSSVNNAETPREEEIGSIHPDAPPQSRHNQIAACTYKLNSALGIIGFFQRLAGRSDINTLAAIPGPCYPENPDAASIDFGPLGTLSIVDNSRHRLLDWYNDGEKDRIPPADEQYDNFISYWRAYKDWRGEWCSPAIPVGGGFKIYACIEDPTDPNYWSNLFYYIPFTSTEDREGHAEAFTSISNTTQPPSGVRITDIRFNSVIPDGEEDTLYFPHMLEDAQLADLLQSTYKPFDTPEIYSNFNTGPYNTHSCEILDSRTNPGDDLFGEYDNPDQDRIPIQGDVAYTGEFSCDFTPVQAETPEYCQGPNYIDNRCNTDWAGTCCDDPASSTTDSCTHSWVEGYYQCNTGGGIRGYSTCQIDLATATSIYTVVPYVEENWDRYVDGAMSIFKRMFPRTGPEVEYETPVSEIKDIPAKTYGSYQSEDPDVEILAGDLSQGRTGDSAEIFFPHIGSIYDYFLKGIQKALRPHDISTYVPGVGQSSEIPVTQDQIDSFESIACPDTVPALGVYEEGIQCEANCNNIPDSAVPARWLGGFKEGVIDLAHRWVAEGGENSLVEQCYNDVVVRSLNAGINPIYSLSIWIQESDASNYNSNVTYCDPNSPSQTVQDFGINIPSIAGNFDAQITYFLRLPYLYPNSYEQCFVNGCSLATFSRVYQQGASASCEINSSALRYAQKTLNTMSLISPSCQPKYPTDTSCQ